MEPRIVKFNGHKININRNLLFDTELHNHNEVLADVSTIVAQLRHDTQRKMIICDEHLAIPLTAEKEDIRKVKPDFFDPNHDTILDMSYLPKDYSVFGGLDGLNDYAVGVPFTEAVKSDNGTIYLSGGNDYNSYLIHQALLYEITMQWLEGDETVPLTIVLFDHSKYPLLRAALEAKHISVIAEAAYDEVGGYKLDGWDKLRRCFGKVIKEKDYEEKSTRAGRIREER